MGSKNVQEARPAMAAGKFYPADPEFLGKVVDDYLHAGAETEGELPKAVIAPHSGFIYSGPVAGSAFRAWRDAHEIHRVVLIGPSHLYEFPGLALPDATVFSTPLGEIEVDVDCTEELKKLSFIRVFEGAHEPEHSLEVELPFLQKLFTNFTIVPIVTGVTEPEQVATALGVVWGGPETLIVVSSDLSHYHSYAGAKRDDAVTARMIESLDYRELTPDRACGAHAIRGLLKTALNREMRCELRDLRNSGDTAGIESEVIGFGAFHFFEL
jgi:MEMO1 family protein